MCETRLNALQSLSQRYQRCLDRFALGNYKVRDCKSAYTIITVGLKEKPKSVNATNKFASKVNHCLPSAARREREAARVGETENTQCRRDRLIHSIYRATTEAARDKNFN